jgi:uncharacterized membrane protein YccC
MGAALSRFQATAVGSVLGLACLLLLPDGWSTAAALAVSMLVVGGAAGLRSDWSYGSVAAVSIALAPTGNVIEVAGERALAIVLGAGAGVIVSLFAWPDRAEARFERHFRAALRVTAKRLEDAVGDTLDGSQKPARPEHISTYHNTVRLADEAIDAAKLVRRDGMKQRLDALKRLYESIIILERAADAKGLPARESGAKRVRDQVDEFRRDACRVLTALAEGDRGDCTNLRRMDCALEGLCASVASENPASDQHRAASALAFGLHEVQQTLAALIEAQLGQEPRHP